MYTIETNKKRPNTVDVFDEKRSAQLGMASINFAMKSYPTAVVRKEKMFINFSGGRTSAYMTKKLMDSYSDQYDFIVLFANTGQEHPKTLKFIDDCDRNFGFKTIWLEAVVDPEKGKATKHKIVNYQNCWKWDTHLTSKEMGPFEQVIAKYGIPNMGARNVCNRDLKLQVIRSFRKTVEDYKTALTGIGIRADEPTRLESKKDTRWEKENIVYPLAHWFQRDKQDVNDFWEDQDFNLEIEEYEGNCLTCWKKSLRKHLTIAKENPQYFDFFKKMEAKYPRTNVREEDPDRKFFRQHMSVDNLFELAETYKKVLPRHHSRDLDENSGCTESCEMF